MTQINNETDLAWLAGILEGEGYFGYRDSPVIAVSMTDKDVIERVAFMLDAKVKQIVFLRNPNYKDQWRIDVTGERAFNAMRAIRPWMGERRGKKIDEILSKAEGHLGPAYGARLPQTKLNEQNIILIRHLLGRRVKQKVIADTCGVSRAAISHIKTRKNWSWVGGI